jgi:hypothetical protein
MLMSPRTSPVVRERLVDIVGAAAYASGTSESFVSDLRNLYDPSSDAKIPL